LQALRLVQEALNNAYKHAHAKNVYFSARFDGQFDLMTLSVRDDGRGLMPPMDRGRGISNMRYRAREMGGVFQLIEHHPGVEVLLRVPRVSAQHQSDSNELVADGHVDRLRL
jgi:signal transduction histidine kinase